MEKKKKSTKIKMWLVIAFFAAAAILSGIFMGRVAINYNLADYLGNDTQTKIALNIIENEFGMTSSLQVMAQNVKSDTAEEICGKIEIVPNVLNVNFDKYDETYFKDDNALFIVIIDGDDYSDNAKQVINDVKEVLAEYDGMEYAGTAIDKQRLQESITSEMGFILAVSLCLVVAILLITSESWVEPFIFLIASGVAVLINRGTNVFFGEISYITNSISAILQLALSIDYSIVLLSNYRREKEKHTGDGEAMGAAIKGVLKPISASALTTMAGLLALLFMSFRIGFDIGIVLMKGIVISAVTSVTLLPALILLSDKLIKKTKKKPFVPKGKFFTSTAKKGGKVIAPIALVLIVLCGYLQTRNTYTFADTKYQESAITEVFGNNNSVVVVYKNSENNYANEQKLVELVENYKTSDGKSVLSNYTAYTNTVREEYDVDKASKKLELNESDTKMLFTMYHLYQSPEEVKLSFKEFIDFANDLVENDEDAQEFVDEEIVKALKTLKVAEEIAISDLTADELYTVLTTGVMEDTDISLFSLKQIYGLYLYDDIENKKVDFQTMLNFLILSSNDENLNNMIDEETITQLQTLKEGIITFKTQMETLMDQQTFKGWFYQNSGALLSDEELQQIWAGYFMTSGESTQETIPFLPLLKFLVQSQLITDSALIDQINGYDYLYQMINQSYGYEEFLSALSQIAYILSGSVYEIKVDEKAIQQIYIMYFYDQKLLKEEKINGKKFVEYLLSVKDTNSVIQEQLSEENLNKLQDLLTVNKYYLNEQKMTYKEAYLKIDELQKEITSNMVSAKLDEDKISGVYIKYAINFDNNLTDAIMACDLVDFLTANMDKNSLLQEKIDDEKRQKVKDAENDIEKAEDLFVGKNYSRVLLSLNLLNESQETTDFVDYLSKEVKEIFGEDSYITGEIVSTYDLEQSFSHDNMFITIFTLIAIFIIIMVVFRSLSLPLILVTMIQGAIFIAMSTQLLGNGLFFMSYIVATCILMGATIDYGILMSSNYVAHRSKYDKEKSLELSVEAAMPTIFTSGLILIVCGFVISIISSQNSISTVGLLLGIGTICSVIIITMVLPSVLYLLDKFILKLSFKRKDKKQEKISDDQ